MNGDVNFVVATARHGARIAAAERAVRLHGFALPKRRRWFFRVRAQRTHARSACHGHGSDANSFDASTVAPLARSKMALE